MFALIALGMCFVIMTGGIDLSVGSTAAMSSVVAALFSPYGACAGLAGRRSRPAPSSALLNGLIVTRLGILPFIATLATMLAASGTGPAARRTTHRSRSPTTPAFVDLGQGDLFGAADPGLDRRARPMSCGLGPAATSPRFGRYVLAVGGGEEATRLMGLPVDRVKLLVYIMSGRSPASPASSWPPSSAPASRPRASAGSCSRSPRSWSAARC